MTHVFGCALGPELAPGIRDYWAAVTDIPCRLPQCAGTIRWAEAGNVPGWRECDLCGAEFMAIGTADQPMLRLEPADDKSE